MDSHNLDEAAAHALNALPADEADELERLQDDELADELASFRRVAVALTDGLPDIVPAASPELWDRISAEAGITPPPPPVAGARRILRPSLMLAAAAVVAVVAVGATSLLAIRDSAPDTRSLAAAATNAEGSFTATLTSPEGMEEITPEVVIAADGTGYVVADSLPRLAESRTYQLWLIVDDRVISAALLGNDPDVVQFRAEGNIAGIAISNEPAGGVVVSEVSPTALWLSDTL
jgi:Anti-sigma-K factor rskA, C-terminal